MTLTCDEIDRATVHELRAEVLHLNGEVVRLKADLAEAVAKTKGTYCAYCGQEYPLDDQAAAAVSQHIKTCPKHPLRAAEAEIARLNIIVTTVCVPCECKNRPSDGHNPCPICHGLGWVPPASG